MCETAPVASPAARDRDRGLCDKPAGVAVLELLATMEEARQGDRREGILLRQSRGWFSVAGMGQEGVAADGDALRRRGPGSSAVEGHRVGGEGPLGDVSGLACESCIGQGEGVDRCGPGVAVERPLVPLLPGEVVRRISCLHRVDGTPRIRVEGISGDGPRRGVLPLGLRGEPAPEHCGRTARLDGADVDHGISREVEEVVGHADEPRIGREVDSGLHREAVVEPVGHLVPPEPERGDLHGLAGAGDEGASRERHERGVVLRERERVRVGGVVRPSASAGGEERGQDRGGPAGQVVRASPSSRSGGRSRAG